MKKTIKKIIKSFLSDYQIRVIKMRIMKLISFKKDINTPYTVTSFGDKKDNTFFGYYDISPFNPQTDELIYLNISENQNEASIIMKNISTLDEKKVGQTLAWNWQQGARLRWFPKMHDTIIYNNYTNTGYVSEILNVLTGSKKIIDWPIYDINSQGTYGLTLDFVKLGALRPGYGYSNTEYIESESAEKEGIFLVDINSNSSHRIIGYSDIFSLLGVKKDEYNNCYINHLSFSPSGEKFLFFAIRILDNGVHKASLFIYNLKYKSLKLLEDELSVSHYTWIDDELLLVTAYDMKRNCRYYTYDVYGNREILLSSLLTRDGHPTLIEEDKIITDTYIDKYGYQKIFCVNLKTGRIEDLIEIYSSYKKFGEERCDLHPRVNTKNNYICFDGNVNGNRNIYLLRGWKYE